VACAPPSTLARCQAEDIDAELGELVLGSHPGRRDDNELTVAKLIGLSVQKRWRVWPNVPSANASTRSGRTE
jgi:hypothetical protein